MEIVERTRLRKIKKRSTIIESSRFSYRMQKKTGFSVRIRSQMEDKFQIVDTTAN